VAHLSTRERSTLRQVAAALFRPAGGVVEAERLDWLVTELPAYARSLTLLSSLALHGALLAARLAPVLTGRGLRTLDGCDADEREAALHALEAGPLGLSMVLLKVTCTLVYFEHPGALRETGYDAIGRLGPAFPDSGASPIESRA